MLNTIGLWIILGSSFLALTLMLLYANGTLAKWIKPLRRKHQMRTKVKAKKRQEKQEAKELERLQALEEEFELKKERNSETPSAEKWTELTNAVLEKKEKKPEKTEEKEAEEDGEIRRISFVTSFHKGLFGVFFAGAILFLPYYWEYFSGDFLIFRLLKMVFMSVHNTVRLFILDGDFEPIHHVIRNSVSIGNPGWLTAVQCVYSLYATILYLVAPFMTAGFVLSLFKGITAYYKYQRWSKADEVYLISELNERSIELAKDILSEKRIAQLPEEQRNKKRIIVFAEVFGRSEERSFELISQAKNLGAYCFKRDVADLGLKRGGINKSTVQKVYFIGENEDENVEQALIMIEACRKNEKFNTKNTHFYVFATTVESEALLDFVDNGNMTVRRVNENKDLAISTLRKHKIFERAVPCKRNKQTEPLFDEQGNEKKTIFAREDLKVLRVLIVGLGNYGTELLKMLCWSCQMFTYVVEVYVFDKSGEARAKMSRIAPDLLRYSEEGDGITRPYYKIDFTEDADVNSGAFYEKLDKKLPGAVTTVFVTLGEDELNIQTAMGLRAYFGRRVQKDAERREELKRNNQTEEDARTEWQETIPQIFSTVYSEVKNRIFDRNEGLQNSEGKNYGITFIGNMTERYSLSFIQQETLMEAGKAIHCQYSGAQELEELTERIQKMETLYIEKDLKTIRKDLQERAEKFRQTIERLSGDIMDRVDALWEGKDQTVAELWKAELKEDKTTAVEKEIAALEKELAITPQAILLEARKDDYVGLVNMVKKKRALTIVYEWFERVLKERGETEWEERYSLESFLRQLIDLAYDRVYKLKENLMKARNDYDRYEYYRASSIATAIHEEFRNELYDTKDYEKLLREDEEYQKATAAARSEMYKQRAKKLNGALEHLRWQAYMWAEGYQKGLYKSSIDKTHHKLVATNQRRREDEETSEDMAGCED